MGSPRKISPAAPQVVLYDKIIATHPEIERKGAANPDTSRSREGMDTHGKRMASKFFGMVCRF